MRLSALFLNEIFVAMRNKESLKPNMPLQCANYGWIEVAMLQDGVLR